MSEDFFERGRDFGELVIHARDLANLLHFDQQDRAGMPYFCHVDQVAKYTKNLFSSNRAVFKSFGFSCKEAQIVAYCHDLLEDQGHRISLTDIRVMFGSKIANAVDAISQKEKESQLDYLNRCMENDLAHFVKICDMAHNMELARFFVKGLPSKSELYLLQNRYLPNYKILLRAMEEKLKDKQQQKLWETRAKLRHGVPLGWAEESS